MIVLTSGKGGVGKTTISSLLLSTLPTYWKGRVLVVDADPIQSLHFALGIPAPTTTLAQIADEIDLTPKSRQSKHGVEQELANLMDKKQVITRHTIVNRTFHYMAMGREHRAGCYCQINQVLSRVLDSLWSQFDLILVDAEAGTEHLNRKRFPHIDILLVVATPDRSALAAAGQMVQAIDEAGITVDTSLLLINRANYVVPNMPDSLQHMDLVHLLPHTNAELRHLEEDGKPVVDLSVFAPLRMEISTIAGMIAHKLTLPDTQTLHHPSLT